MSRTRLGALALVGLFVAAAAGLWWAREDVPVVPAQRVRDAPVLVVGGDVNLSRRQHIHTRRQGPAAGLAGVPQIERADLAFANLECVVATVGESGGDKGEGGGYFYFRGRPEMLGVVEHAGLDVLGTANNHIGDYGPQALLDQARWLDAMNLAHVGSGPDRERACAPAIRHARDLAVAFFMLDATQPEYAASPDHPGTCHLALDDADAWRSELGPRIASARESADLVMVAVHWGPNNASEPSRDEIEVGHAIIDAGADAVLGSSAHVLQGIEVYAGRPILHDAGNLLFDFTKKTVRDSAVFGLALGRDGVLGIRVTPILSRAGQSHVATGEDATRILETLRERSDALDARLTIDGEEGVVALPVPPARPAPTRPAPPDPPPAPAPAPLTEPPPQCVVQEVPASARIDPIEFGPLALVGLELDPTTLHEPASVGLTTYWTTDAPTEDDFILFERFIPTTTDPNGTWGNDHDPCDWQWPTSRWKPGAIYRDAVQIRPPDHFRGDDYELKVGLWLGGKKHGPRPVVGRLRIDPSP